MAASVDLLKALNRRAGDVEAVEEVVEGFVVEAERAEELRRVLVGDGAGAAGVGGLDWREPEEELAAMGREKGEEERVVEDERREREVESALAGLQRVSLEEIRPAETASESVVDAVAKRQQEVPKQISVLSQRELQETAWTT